MKNSQVPISNLFFCIREDFISQSEPLVWDIIWQSQCDAVTRQNNKTRFCNSMMTNTLLRSLMRHQLQCGDKIKFNFASLAFSTSCERFLYCRSLFYVNTVFIFFVFCFGKKYTSNETVKRKKYEKIIPSNTIQSHPKKYQINPMFEKNWIFILYFLKATIVDISIGLFVQNDIARNPEFYVTDCWANRKK